MTTGFVERESDEGLPDAPGHTLRWTADREDHAAAECSCGWEDWAHGFDAGALVAAAAGDHVEEADAA